MSNLTGKIDQVKDTDLVEKFDNSIIMLSQLTNDSRNRKVNMKTSFSTEVFIRSVQKCIRKFSIDTKELS